MYSAFAAVAYSRPAASDIKAVRFQHKTLGNHSAQNLGDGPRKAGNHGRRCKAPYPCTTYQPLDQHAGGRACNHRWLFLVCSFSPFQLQGHTNNPYIGIVVFIVIPVIFIFGLVLIAFGVFLARRRIALVEKGLLERVDGKTCIRRLAIFFAVTTAANIVIGTQGTYRAVESSAPHL